MSKFNIRILLILILAPSLFLSIIIFNGCKFENEEEYFQNSSNSGLTCDTLYVTYSQHIKPFFDNKCVSCHMGGGVDGCDLDSYDNTMSYVTRSIPPTLLFDYVEENTHQGVVIDSCEFIQLKKWLLNPAP